MTTDDNGTGTDTRPLTPEARARKDAGGMPVVIDGRAWLLCDFVPGLEPCWDRLFDDNFVGGFYAARDVDAAAIRILWHNYDITPREAAALIARAPREELVAAVEVALFGSDRVHKTYSDWARSALLSAGLDPAAVPHAQLRNVLDHLVASGRVIAAADFVTSALAARVRRNFGDPSILDADAGADTDAEAEAP